MLHLVGLSIFMQKECFFCYCCFFFFFFLLCSLSMVSSHTVYMLFNKVLLIELAPEFAFDVCVVMFCFILVYGLILSI